MLKIKWLIEMREFETNGETVKDSLIQQYIIKLLSIFRLYSI